MIAQRLVAAARAKERSFGALFLCVESAGGAFMKKVTQNGKM
ncbi:MULTISPECIES: hypothetical protein [Paenibacillus]|nr:MULTISPECIES: hypothetical protein [Paenibacillus]